MLIYLRKKKDIKDTNSTFFLRDANHLNYIVGQY